LVPERRSLADVRKGGYEGVKADVADGRRLQDFGPHRIGKAGAVAVGARTPLIAFNVYLAGEDETAAKEVARAVRESSGGLRNVRAIGFFVPERGCLTVSMNLVDHEATPIHRAFELVKREGARYGLHVLDTEIVGLVPQAALAADAAFHLQLRGFDPAEQIVENLVARVEAQERSGSGIGSERVSVFLDVLASDEPTPGGGSAAAVAGAAGAALVAMVGRLTIGKKKYEAVEDRMREIVEEADRARDELLAMADRDAEAFDHVMAAYRLPKENDEEKAARSEAIRAALLGAADLPLGVATRAVSLLAMAREATETGNATAASDGATAAHLLFASAQGALRNVEINIAGMEGSDADRLKADASLLDVSSRELLEATASAFAARV
jgi:glutamate formiminotransferase / formiminotetrahydrofolate cyclodeaminase